MIANLAPPASTHRHLGGPLLASGGLILGCFALRAVDPSGAPTICPFKAWTGLDCPGCGVTRATHELLNGHVVAALDLNLLFVLAFPLIAWWVGKSLVGAFRGRRVSIPQIPVPRLVALIVVVSAFGVLRNLPFPPLAWLGTG